MTDVSISHSEPERWIRFAGSVFRNNLDCVNYSRKTPKEPQKNIQDHLTRRTTDEDRDRRKDNRQKVEQKVAHGFATNSVLDARVLRTV